MIMLKLRSEIVIVAKEDKNTGYRGSIVEITKDELKIELNNEKETSISIPIKNLKNIPQSYERIYLFTNSMLDRHYYKLTEEQKKLVECLENGDFLSSEYEYENIIEIIVDNLDFDITKEDEENEYFKISINYL